MAYLENYLRAVKDKNSNTDTASIENSVSELVDSKLSRVAARTHATGLLLGQVQSGKTGQIFGTVAKAADSGWKFFVLLTTDNVFLYKQTVERAYSSLTDVTVCDENDEIRFIHTPRQKPLLVILKKNANILKGWHQIIANSTIDRNQKVLIIDDEGDAASLNTRINQSGDKSTIHRHLNSLKNLFPSIIYLQVTATPQSLVLQAKASGWHPEFVHYFDPGQTYAGGEVFYGEESQCPRIIPDADANRLIQGNSSPESLRKALLSFLLAGAQRLNEGASVCSMLIHPGIKVAQHEAVESKIKNLLHGIISDLNADSYSIKAVLEEEWHDLKKTYPNLEDFPKLAESVRQTASGIKIITVNQNTPDGVQYSDGLNIVIGGNSLGRGLTFPGLHTVYYCRTARTPQADTVWQHSRLFGYDRQTGLCRVYLLSNLLTLFRHLNASNSAMISTLKTRGWDGINLVYPRGVRPTRANVIRTAELSVISWGVNYFPSIPAEGDLDKLDRAIGVKDSDLEISLEKAEKILSLTHSESDGLWHKKWLCSSIEALSKASKTPISCRLIVRVDRNIGKGTGTLLSPNDRTLSDSIKNQLVLIMYRLTGSKEKGWNGKPLWVPNIKFPEPFFFYQNLAN